MRQGGHARCQTLYSTPSARSTDRRLTLLNRHAGQMEASIPAGAQIVTDRILRLFTRWVAAEEGGPVAQLWAPATDPGRDDWRFDFLPGAPNTFSHATPIDALVPAWPEVVSGEAGSVGTDPYAL